LVGDGIGVGDGTAVGEEVGAGEEVGVGVRTGAGDIVGDKIVFSGSAGVGDAAHATIKNNNSKPIRARL
jgi:hypothetical protein